MADERSKFATAPTREVELLYDMWRRAPHLEPIEDARLSVDEIFCRAE